MPVNVPDVYRGAGEDGGAVAVFPARAIARRADRLDLRSILSTFRRRLKLFLYTAIIIAEAAAILAVWLPKRYTAVADVVIKTPDQTVTPTPTPTASGQPSSSSDVDTEIEVLTSRSLADKVVTYLKLENDPDMRALMAGGIAVRAERTLGLVPPLPTVQSPQDRAHLRELVINHVLDNLDVERLTSAYALSLSYTDGSPARAAMIVNAFAHLYSAGQVSQKQAQNQDAVRVLGARIDALRQRAQADFAVLQGYRIRNNLLSTTGASLTEQEISAYNQAVASARAQAAEDAARLSTARAQLRQGSNGDDVGEALDSPVVHALRAQQSQLGATVADYAGRYGPKNPDLLDAMRQLAEVNSQIQAEINRTISNLDAKARVSGERVASLYGSLGSARSTLADNNRAMVELDDLQRRADTSQQLYESYLNRYKEAVAAAGAERPDSRLISDARIPTAPSAPRSKLIMTFGVLLGIGVGIAAALIAEVSFSGLTTSEEVEDRLGLPYLGGVPELKPGESDADGLLETMRTKPRSAFAEAFRGILAALRQTGERSQVILVTSALPNEGKTTISACLAEAAAAGSERVVIIDCDTIRSQLSKRFAKSASGRPGLREVLAGTEPFASAIMDSAGSDVRMLPITTPFAANEPLLDNGKMHALLAQLREHYDLIILDTPPVLPVAETRELAVLADRIVLVGRWRRTPDRALLNAIRLLPPVVRRVTGVALTRIDMRKQVSFGYGDPASFYGEYREYYSG